MAEYINKAELQYDLANFTGWCEDERKAGVLFVEDCVIPNAPTIDIVHCSECKHYDEDAISINIGWCSEFNGGRSADFFCADGESEVRRNKDEQRTVLDEAVRSNER